MTFWIILVAVILIGVLWWWSRANQNNTLDRTNNKSDVHFQKNGVPYHQTHLATEASEELTPYQPRDSKNDDVHYHQTHLAAETSEVQTPSQSVSAPSSVQNQAEQDVRQKQEQNKE